MCDNRLAIPLANPNTAGFTLVEMMVVIAIIAILASLAVPSFNQQIRQMKIIDAANQLEAAFKDGRTQAQIYQRATRVVLSNNQPKGATVLFVKNNTADADEKLAFYGLDNAFNVDNSSITAVSFTPNKRAYQGETGSGDLMTGQTKFSVCDRAGSGLDKYSVWVDGNSNVMLDKDGTC